MQRQLYFDISSTESGGSLYRAKDKEGTICFTYHHSTYDEYSGEVKVFHTSYPSFAAFWYELTKDPEWFYLHPLYVHPEVRDFVQEQLKEANWDIHPNKKWQESHQRQWKKVLSDPEDYYHPL